MSGNSYTRTNVTYGSCTWGSLHSGQLRVAAHLLDTGIANVSIGYKIKPSVFLCLRLELWATERKTRDNRKMTRHNTLTRKNKQKHLPSKLTGVLGSILKRARNVVTRRPRLNVVHEGRFVETHAVVTVAARLNFKMTKKHDSEKIYVFGTPRTSVGSFVMT